MILSIEERGLRFAVSDPYGQEFCEQEQMFVEGEGTLYDTRNDAALKIRELLLEEHGDKPVRKFRAPVYLELYAIAEVEQSVIEDWLIGCCVPRG